MFFRFFRLITMMILLVINVIFGVISAVSPYYELFLACAFVCGFASVGFGTVIFCWMTEILNGKEKTIFGSAGNLNLAVG